MSTGGLAVLDFGAFPGSDVTSLAIIGQAGILATTQVEAWVSANQSSPLSDVTSDELLIDPVKVYAGDIVPGVGFTIYCVVDDGGPAQPNGGRSGKVNVEWIHGA